MATQIQAPKIPISSIKPLFKHLDFTIINTEIVFKGKKFSGNDYTNFRSASGKYYTCLEICYFMRSETKNLTHAKYVAFTHNLGVGFIRSEDKANLKAYLKGEIRDCKNIDHFAIAAVKSKCPEFSFLTTDNYNLNYFADDFSTYGPIIHPPIADGNLKIIEDLKSSVEEGIEKITSERIKEPKKGLKSPIIIAPNIDSMVINYKNCPFILSGGRNTRSKPSNSTESRSSKNTKSKGNEKSKPEDDPFIIKKRSRHDQTISIFFKVRESAKGMKKEDINRIVCIFTEGQKWQFNGWGDNVDTIFKSTLGICVRKKNAAPIPEDSEIKRLGINVLEVEDSSEKEVLKSVGKIWELIYKNIELNYKDVVMY